MAEPIKDDFELYESGIDAFCFLKECYSVPRDSDNPTVGTCVIPDERLQQLILDKQKEYIDSGKKYTVILHTTHMSIPPTEYLKSPEYKVTLDYDKMNDRDPERAAKYIEPITLETYETCTMINVLPGYCAADIGGFPPTPLLFNGLNASMGGARRSAAARLFDPDINISSKHIRKIDMASIKSQSRNEELFTSKLRKDGLSLYGKEGNKIPNFWCKSDSNPVATCGKKIPMAIYIIRWGIPGNTGPLINMLRIKPTTRLSEITPSDEFSTYSIFEYIRTKYPSNDQHYTDHFISACQVYNKELVDGSHVEQITELIEIWTTLFSNSRIAMGLFTLSQQDQQSESQTLAGEYQAETGVGAIHPAEDELGSWMGDAGMKGVGLDVISLIKKSEELLKILSAAQKLEIINSLRAYKDRVFPDGPDSGAGAGDGAGAGAGEKR